MICHKKRYTSFTHAKWDAVQLNRKREETFIVYMCKGCNKFHVGSICQFDINSSNRRTGGCV